MIEALWSVTFSTPQGVAGSGVVVFETGRIFGGDSFYYYVGDYTASNDDVHGKVDIIHYSGPLVNVFGPVNRVTLQFVGRVAADSMQAQAVGVDPTNPTRQLNMAFKRLAALP
jgi:hypothetical protein